MKKFLFLILVVIIVSCSTEKKSGSVLRSGELVTTRKYIGNFIDYCHTGPDVFGSDNLIWIKTTVYPAYGKLSAYSKNCRFLEGERIYLKRISPNPGPFGNWEYQVENDSSVVYRVSEYRYENNVLVLAWF